MKNTDSSAAPWGHVFEQNAQDFRETDHFFQANMICSTMFNHAWPIHKVSSKIRIDWQRERSQLTLALLQDVGNMLEHVGTCCNKSDSVFMWSQSIIASSCTARRYTTIHQQFLALWSNIVEVQRVGRDHLQWFCPAVCFTWESMVS